MTAVRSFGDWLRQRRRALDIIQEELASQVGCLAITLRLSVGPHPAPAAHATRERLLAAARAQLVETAFAAAQAEGRAMTLEQAIELALAGDENAL